MFVRKESNVAATVDIVVSLAKYAASMLGNPYSIKCVVCDDDDDDDRSVFARDVAVVLRNIHSKHPVTQIVCSHCEEYHEQFGCGTKSLLYFIGQWLQTGTELLQEGIPVHIITATLVKIIDSCVQYVDTLTFSVDNFLGTSTTETSSAATLGVFQIENPSSFPAPQPPTNPEDVSWFFEDVELTPTNLEGRKGTKLSNSEPRESEERTSLENNSATLDKLENNKVISSSNADDKHGEDNEDDDFKHCFDEVICFNDDDDDSKQSDPIKETQYINKHPAFCLPNEPDCNNCSTSQVLTDNSEREDYLQHRVEDYLKTKLDERRLSNPSPSLCFSRYFNSFNSESILSPGSAIDQTAAGSKLVEDFNDTIILKENTNQNYFPSCIENSDKFSVDHDIWQRVKNLVQGLSHGAQTEVTDCVLEAVKHQNEDQVKPLQLDVNRLHTCCIQGPNIRKSEFVSGVVLSVHREVFPIVEDRTHSVLLINGDVCYQNSHLGYKKLAQVKEEYSYNDYILVAEKDGWLNQVEWIIKNLAVTILVARGCVDDQLKAILAGHHVLVVDAVTPTTMTALSYNTNPIVYILDASVENVIQGVTVETLESVPQNKARNTFLTLRSDQFQVQTLVLCHATCAGLEVMEQEFWLCCHRVSQALSHKKLLAGSGVTELQVARYLEDTLRGQSSHGATITDNLYEAEIVSKVANTFRNYHCNIQHNCGVIINQQQTRCEEHQEGLELSEFTILDDYHSKVHSWKRAVRLVCILLHTDAHIILS